MTDDRTPANRPLTKSTLLPAIIAAFVLLTLTGLAATLATYRANGAANYVAHTTEVRLTLQKLFSQVQDLRLAQRGYTATGSQAAIALFQETEAVIPTTLKYLTEITADNPSQGERITRLAPAISSFALQLWLSIENVARPRVDTPSQSSATMESGGQLSGIRAAIAEMDETERRLYSERQAVASRTQTFLLATIIGALALTAILGLLVSLTARRQITELRIANAALAAEMQERNLVEAQLRQAQKMEAVGQLTGGIAHDFNNMLAVIVGSLDMLARRLQGSHPQYMELVRMAVNGADRASALTRRLLAFSRLQPLDPKPTDVNRCVGDLSEMLRRTLGERIVLETVLAGGAWHTLIDRSQLESAILNIAVNARDAMPEGGRLTIETGNAYLDQAYAQSHIEVQAGQYVLVAVTDTGSGMPPSVMNKAFDPFFTTKPTGAGTGLGLSQVHGFIKQSGGHVKLYSELGVGSTVKLYLPRYRGADTPVDQPSMITAADMAAPDTSILLVEDELDVRTYAAAALHELGYRVVVVDAPVAALEVLRGTVQIDLLLTDVVMPGMTGRQLADEAVKLRPDLKILYMTGYTRNAIVHNGVLDAGTHLLSKPFTLTQLASELQRVLAADRGKEL